MGITRWITALALVAGVVSAAPPALATDIDGPDDCSRSIEDWGDAPECIVAYPTGVVGRFPTCFAPCGPPGTMEVACPPISTPPGPTGFVRHLQEPGGYWLGCWGLAGGAAGIDTEADGKVNTPAVGASACAPIPTDCIESAYGMTFDQDECTGDLSDAAIDTPVRFLTCTTGSLFLPVFNCGQPRQIFLNVLVDWNHDGDWNDNLSCPGACAYEWAVKNFVFSLPGTGCFPLTSPPFLSGPLPGPSWMRVTISNDPVPDDFPWNGSAGLAALQALLGGETEDYPAEVFAATATSPTTWGRMKTLYH
jgi:hypothetical protein